MKLTAEKIDLLANGTREDRTYACAVSFKLFAVYYFSRYFKFKIPAFHDDFYEDFENLVYGRAKNGAWVGYRECAKTSIACSMGLAWVIARKTVIDKLAEEGQDVSHWGTRHYINVDCYDKDHAEALLFDLVTELQSNEDIIADFGQLFNQARTTDQAQRKRSSDFITTNAIRVEAHSVLESVRGRKHGDKRPDFRILDDVENEITVRSPVISEKITTILDAGKGGMPDYGSTLVLGNYLAENGVIAYLMRQVKGSGGIVRFIPVVDKEGNISWPDKYVKTDLDAVQANEGITEPSLRKVSLESKKREMNAGGRRVYEVEMMLDPVAAGSPFFDRSIIDRLIKNCTDPIADKAGFLIWSPFKPGHRYALGADTGKGNGGDHSTSCAIDFTPTPAQQVGSYANNEIPADLFAHELKREGDMYGTCLIGPEKNAESGGACLTTLKMIYPVDFIYRQVPMDRASDKPLSSGELGWETNGATKYTILFDLKTAIEDGLLIINDIRILMECRSFTFSDADALGKNHQGHFTNHFDLLMATAIAWAMRKHAREHKPATKGYEQGAYEPSTL